MFQIFMFESVLKISEHVEIYNACWKHIEKECWKLKKACWNFQNVLKTVKKQTVTHVESYVKISRCVENVYVRCIENHIENHDEAWKNTITLYGMCWNRAADFVFLLRFCTSNWSETYICTCGLETESQNEVIFFELKIDCLGNGNCNFIVGNVLDKLIWRWYGWVNIDKWRFSCS